MATRVYGASDDLIEFEGDVNGEEGVSFPKSTAVVLFSDGTRLRVTYGDKGLWKITALTVGDLFDRIDEVHEETDEGGYSATAFFREGLTWAKIRGKKVR